MLQSLIMKVNNPLLTAQLELAALQLFQDLHNNDHIAHLLSPTDRYILSDLITNKIRETTRLKHEIK